MERTVLIPLLLDDLLWELKKHFDKVHELVLIPLLLDDPLWVLQILRDGNTISLGLNPSFAG